MTTSTTPTATVRAVITVARATELAATRKGHKNVRRVFTRPSMPDAVFVVTKTCMENGKTLREHAHAHCKRDEYRGLVCVRPEHADDETLLHHEYAHLCVPPSGSSHGKAWQEAITALGYPQEAEPYQEKYDRAAERRVATIAAKRARQFTVVLPASYSIDIDPAVLFNADGTVNVEAARAAVFEGFMSGVSSPDDWGNVICVQNADYDVLHTADYEPWTAEDEAAMNEVAA